ncbi:MAG: AMP-binding protein, partial [Burkholderiales bacterium]|nr:AMP-binding protein [Burkholderiales bacterium]
KRLTDFLKADRESGFDLHSAPLFRLTLINLPNNQYYFIMTFHHVIMDGWSLPILLNELNIIYQAKKFDNEIILPQIISYKDFISWHQRKNISQARFFWKKYLKNFLINDDLASLYKDDKKNKSADIVDIKAILSQPLSNKLRLFSQSERLTLNTIFQGIWGLLLSKYSQNNDIGFGVTLTERTPEIDNSDQIIGLLINTLPLRIQFKKNISIKDYLKEVQNNFLKIMEYHYSPLSELHTWSHVASSSPLFNNIFVFENYPKYEENSHAIKFSDAAIFDPTHYPLSCIIIPDNKLIIKLAYDRNKFDDKIIEKLLSHFQNLLKECTNRPEKLIYNINMLSSQEYQKISREWSHSKIELTNKTIHEIFEDQAEKSPDKIAIQFDNQKITYGELNNRSTSLAKFLCKCGVKPSSLVAMAIERGIDMIASLLAILKAGAIYVPIDLEYPKARIISMLDSSKTKIFLTSQEISNYYDSDFLSDLTEQDIKIIYLESYFSLSNIDKISLPKIHNNDNLAYVIFTSGSTGIPKAASVSHKTIVNLISWQTNDFLEIEKNKIAQFASSGFDVSIQEIFSALFNRKELHIIPKMIKKSPGDLLHFIKLNKINLIFLPTSFLDLFCNEGLQNKYNLCALSAIIVAGEALKITENIRQFFIINKNITLVNHYGPCETHVVSSYTLPKNPLLWPTFPSIGKPIDNCNLYILDKHLNLLPYGLPGDLYIGGIIGCGYLNQQSITKNSFISNPYSPTTKLYKTGDIVKWKEDGNLEFI